MTPNDIYCLPTIRTDPWHAQEEALNDFFGVSCHSFDQDRARGEGADDISFATKLRCAIDWGERSTSYVAVTFRGAPVGLLMTAGRGGRDSVAALVTDSEAFSACLAYMARWTTVPPHDVVDPAADIEDLGILYGTVAVRVGEEVRLVLADRLAEDGTLLFDDVAWTAAFDVIVRPAFRRGMHDDEMEAGFSGPRMKTFAAEAVAAAIPAGVRAAVPDPEALAASLPGHLRDGWHAVAVATDEGTYTVGLPSREASGKWFGWASAIQVERIGGPELFDTLGSPQVADPTPR